MLKQFKLILENNEAIFNTWLKIWLIAHVIKLTRQQKWFDIEQNVKKRKLLFSFWNALWSIDSIWSRISKEAKTRVVRL